MSRVKVNSLMFHGPFLDRYIEKYGRKPKEWTIESLHDLWLRVKARSDKRNSESWDFINKVKDQIEPTHKAYRGRGDEYRIYFKQGDTIRYYSLTYDMSLDSWTRGIDNVKFSTREEKLDFFLATEKEFELGEEQRRLVRLESSLHYVVFEVMWELVENNLREKFKNTRPENSFVIQIADKKYIVSTEDRYGSYKKFKLQSELKEDVLKIN